jgi:ubiquinone/menaquinone biosynthesis C-methylase UbiE/uncharacterized protein YbaR (Trm112 family)
MRSIVIEKYLCCPVDKSYPLQVEEAEWNENDLMSGTLRCSTCGAGYAVTGGIAHLLPQWDSEADPVWEAKLKEASARDLDASVYDASLGTYESRAELSMLTRAIQGKPGDLVLDLGAGTGRLSTILAETGAHVLAVDISYDSLKLNRARCARITGAVVDHVVADVCYLPFRNALANIAGSGMLLEHIPTDDERRRFAEETYRVLQPGGRFALTAYNYSWAKRRHGDREGYHGGDLYYHRFYSSELRELLNSYRVRTITAILSRPGRALKSTVLDRFIALFPPVADVTGMLLFAVVERQD